MIIPLGVSTIESFGICVGVCVCVCWIVVFVLALLLVEGIAVIAEVFRSRSVIVSLYISKTDNLIDTELDSVAFILLERSNRQPAVLMHRPRSA